MSSSPISSPSTPSTPLSPIDPTAHPLYHSILELLPHNLPICVHLNADTAWLILIPCPPSTFPSTSPSACPPHYLTILLDPWFTGLLDGSPLFHAIVYGEKHNIPSSVQSIAELESILCSLHASGDLKSGSTPDRPHDSIVDVVIVSNDNGDHCHGPTLRQLPASIPVLALPAPFKIIQGYQYFTNLHLVKSFDSCVPKGAEGESSFFGLRKGTPKALDWRLASYPHAGIPEWLSIAFTLTPGERPAFHTPLMIAFPRSSASPDPDSFSSASALIYMPHGSPLSSLQPFSLADPKVHTLAILSGLHRVWLTPNLLRISEGAYGAVDLIETLNPDYWIATHDEVKETTAKGIIVPTLLRRDERGEEDLKRFATEKGMARKIVGKGDRRAEGEVKVLVPGSGEACVLGEVEREVVKKEVEVLP